MTDYLHDYLADLIETGRVKPCRACDQTDGLRIIRATGMHFGKIVCDHCDELFNTWAPKPDARPRKRDGRSTHLLGIIREAWGDEPLYCEICLRDERELPEGVWMEAHHVVEHQDGGADTPANLRPVCNECHGLIHWRRKTVHGAQVGKSEKELAHASR